MKGEFLFLNHMELIPRVDWTHRYVSHLWNYNLQYFDYAVDLAWAARLTADRQYTARFTELATSWIEATIGGRGDAWEPYALSSRVVNWAYSLLLLDDQIDVAVRDRITSSLHAQFEAIEARIEWHILANHLQKNLQALAVGSLVMGGGAAARWRSRWVPELWRQVDEQVLFDGGHYERSPMYHCIALGDLLETASLSLACSLEVPNRTLTRLAMMHGALATLTRRDGTLHLFNDAANGIAPPVAYLSRLADIVQGEQREGNTDPGDLPLAGYFAHARPDGTRIIVDCGEPGPSYQPGHAHCDLLSFELDLDGHHLIVDSGVHGYDGDPFREYVRSTRAHNTITIGGAEQSEVWSTFRLARRASGITGSASTSGDVWRFQGSYTPYHDRRVRHTRSVTVEGGVVEVSDAVINARDESINSYLHLHPDYAANVVGSTITAVADESEVTIETFGFEEIVTSYGSMHPEVQGWYCPEFGKAVPIYAIRMRVKHGEEGRFGYRISRCGRLAP